MLNLQKWGLYCRSGLRLYFAAFQDDDGGSTMADDERIRQFIDEGQQALKDKGAKASIDLMLDLVKTHVPKYDPLAYCIVAVMTEFLFELPSPVEHFDTRYLGRRAEDEEPPLDDIVFWDEFWTD
jgi:hypothetical protein